MKVEIELENYEFDPKNNSIGVDHHHENMTALSQRSSSMQIWILIKYMGQHVTEWKNGHYNHADNVLAEWLCKNSQQILDDNQSIDMHKLTRLIEVVDLMDCFGPGVKVPDKKMVDNVRYFMNPIKRHGNRFKHIGEEEQQKALLGSLNRLDKLIRLGYNVNMPEQNKNTTYRVINETQINDIPCIVVRSNDNVFGVLYNEYDMVIAVNDFFRVSIAKRHECIPVDFRNIQETLSGLETGWGGHSCVITSPGNGTSMDLDEIEEIVRMCG